MPTTTIETLGDLISFAADLDSRHGSSSWFRGHRDANWSLQCTLWRRTENEMGRLRDRPYTHADERNFTHRFRVRAAIRRTNAPEYEDCAGWLSLMQHYGLPTRLLDWSRSPMIAAYFAVATGSADAVSDAAIWVLDPHRLNWVTAREMTTPALKSQVVAHLVNDAFFDAREVRHRGGVDHAPQARSAPVMAAMAWEADQRMVVQQGAFTVHAAPPEFERDGLPGMEESDDASDYLQLLRIPGPIVRRFKEQVAAAGLREGDLFPDLEHLARELIQTYPPQTIRAEKH